MASLGLGLTGCGVMGASLAKSAAELDCANVACVHDVDAAKGQALADQLGCAFEADYEALLSRDDVAAVLVATPGFLHEEPAIAAAEAGRHVFCEKPLAPSLSACDGMIAAAGSNNVKLGVGLVCRFHPVHRKVRDLVAAGEVGEATCMTRHRLGGGFGGVWKQEWRTLQAQSGGTLMEVNAHEIDFMRSVAGEVKEVFAAGGRYVRTEADFPDIVLATLKFESGAVGVLHSSDASAIGGYGGRVDGTKGSIAFPTFWGPDGGLRIKRTGTDDEERILTSDLVEDESTVAQEIRAFAEAVLSGREPPVGGADGRAATEIALAAYRSVETGQPVSLPLES